MAGPRAAIIGAGIAGIVTAHALRQTGFEVELFEQDAQRRSTGYQLNVLANGIYALARLGLLEPLKASRAGDTMRSAPIIDGLTGRLVRRIRTVFGAQGEYAGMSFYRGDLHRVLAESSSGPAPRWGKTFRRFTQDPASGEVAVEFTDGLTKPFDLLIGADGAHSLIRKQLFPNRAELVPSVSTLMFAAQVALDGPSEAERLFAEQSRRGEFVQFIAPGTAVILSHAGGGRFAILVAVPDPALAHEVATPEQAKQLARHLVRDIRDPRPRHAIDVGGWEEGNPLVWHTGDIEPLPSFHRGAVALCGDAAHPMIPVVAQGANQSFEDAWRLSAHLSEIAKSGDVRGIPGALESYSRERAPHVAVVQREGRRRVRPVRFHNRLSHRPYCWILRSLPRRVFDRFDEHLLAYAIADPDCSIERA